MRKRSIINVVVALGLFVGSASYAAACGTCGDAAKCQDPQAVQQFKKEVSGLAGILKTKDLELRSEYGMNGIDANRISALETEIQEIKAKIYAVADKLGMPPCCVSV